MHSMRPVWLYPLVSQHPLTEYIIYCPVAPAVGGTGSARRVVDAERSEVLRRPVKLRGRALQVESGGALTVSLGGHGNYFHTRLKLSITNEGLGRVERASAQLTEFGARRNAG